MPYLHNMHTLYILKSESSLVIKVILFNIIGEQLQC